MRNTRSCLRGQVQFTGELRMIAKTLTRFSLAVLILSGAAAAAPAAKIGFQAFLLNGATGRLSPDVLAGDTLLGNVIAGTFSSTSTFIVVKVALGATAPLPRAARVRLLATAAGGKPGRPLLDSTARLGAIGDDGNAYVGFWLADTGCTPVSLTATLTRTGGTVTGKTALSFACNE